MKQRESWIDIAKGLCLIAVILGHIDAELFDFVYSFHLTTFFILSGYTLKQTPITSGYLKQKFSRLMKPYFITCAVVVGMDVLNSLILYKDFTTQTITHILYQGIVRTFFGAGGNLNCGSIGTIAGIGAIWFLPALFFALIITQLVLRLSSKFLQALIAIGMFVFASLLSRIIWLPFSILASFFSVPFLLFGYYLKEYNCLKILRFIHYELLFTAFLAGCFLNVAQVFYIVDCTTKDLFFTPLCAICSSLCIIGFSRMLKHCAPLEYIGKNSLIFLCVHLFQINTLSVHFGNLYKTLNLQYYFLPKILIEITFVILIGSLIVCISTHIKKKSLPVQNNRDTTIDILRAFLIVYMLIGHAHINEGFSRFIYSFHMMAFVMISGYFYSPNLPVSIQLKKAFKTLIPYIIFGILYILAGGFSEITTILLGMSFSRAFFSDIPSVGPVYFILLLFAVKMLYIFLDKIKNELWKNLSIILLFSLGLWLGYCDLWLPWSFDAALVSVLFYHVAYYFQKYDILKKCLSLPCLYFPLSCIWAFMIYSGSMELAIRRYSNTGLTIAGIISAFIILYLLCHYLANSFPINFVQTAGLIGQSTAYILIIHTLFNSTITSYIANLLQLPSTDFLLLIISIATQTTLGSLCCYVIKKLKTFT